MTEREHSQGWWGIDRKGRFTLARDLRRESELVGYYEDEREKRRERNRPYNANSVSLVLEDRGVEVIQDEDTEIESEGERRMGNQMNRDGETTREEAREEDERENEKEERGNRVTLSEGEEEEDSSSAEDDDDNEDFELGQRTMARRGKQWRTSWGIIGRGDSRARERKPRGAIAEKRGRKRGGGQC